MSLFEELKRRNVFRVGIAYVVGSWLLLQFTEVLSGLLELPPQVGPVVVTVVLFGLPLVLIFAWVFELTPEGLKREHEVDREESITGQTGRKLDRVIIVMLVVALGYFIWESRFSQRAPDPAPETMAGSVAGSAEAPEAVESDTVEARSIAVLPFANRSRLEDDEFFVEGIHDDLLTNLARIGALKVISRTSMLRYKDTGKRIPEIAAELGVATIMEGAVQRSGDTVRINVQLIDARTDEHLWAEIFDRRLTAENLFEIQSEIAEKIAAALKATLSPEEQRRISDRPTDNLAAYNAYLRGRQRMARRNSADLEQALAEFERAVELDPQFAMAWVGVAEAANLLPGYSTADSQEMLDRQEQAANRALELNPQLGEAHLSLAEVYRNRERYEEAEAAYRKAIELSPNYATARFWYSNFLANWPSRYRESLELSREAVELDPLSSVIQLSVASHYLNLGRFEDAEAQLERLLEKDPEFAPAFSTRARVAQLRGRFDEQLHWMRKSTELDPGRIFNYLDQASALLNLGDEAGLTSIKRTIRDLDDQHIANGWVAALESLYRQNYAAALEGVNWVDSRTGRLPSTQITFGFIRVLNGDYRGARESLMIAEPRFFERDRWPAALDQYGGLGCVVAWVMARTGDPEMGEALLARTLDYMENELPEYVDHPDFLGYPDCYLIHGDRDEAIAAFQTQVQHGHYAFWWLNTRMPWYEPLRGTPRFEAAMRQIHANNERQRANLARLDLNARI